MEQSQDDPFIEEEGMSSKGYYQDEGEEEEKFDDVSSKSKRSMKSKSKKSNSMGVPVDEEEGEQQERTWFWAFPQIEGVPPSPRGGHTATLIGASILFFGGHYYSDKKTGYTYLNDTHVLDLNASRWIKPKIEGTPPKARYGHTAVLAGSRILIFGGKGPKNAAYRDLHALDPVKMTWYQGPDGAGAPSARFGHTSTLVGGNKMFVFGGWNGKNYFNDLHILDLELMAWKRPDVSGPEPSPRQGH